MVIVLLVPFFSASLFPNTTQYGLWQAFSNLTGETFCYLIYDGSEVRVYSRAWNRYRVPVHLDGSSFSLTIPYPRTGGMRVEGSFRGQELKGEFLVPHVQFKLQGTWYGKQTIKDSHWDPWAFQRADSKGVEDVMGGVSQTLPFTDYPSFLIYWNEVAEKKYYPILTHSLYADHEGIYREKLKKKRLKKLFEYLSSDPDEFLQLTRDFSGWEAKVEKDLTET